ncbi:hypothetical protein FZEAL_2059 [Fusarium zealandicum]|uniref:F-box domain-containing protein n=1 Tax=Fusarium zealandicum TaxID=1053134 RepID=A0A8H4XN46_9HYPO|nr:hypothetical protein FZEAL_2059 [Fusarium zealandicum]
MASAPFLDCPEEVQLAILEILPLPDLATLSMASKGFRRLAEPLVYSTIRLTWTLQLHPPITQLLRTLLERPELSSYIRSIEFAGDGFINDTDGTDEDAEWLDEPETLPGTTALPLNKLSDAVRKTQVSQTTADLWMDKIQSGEADAVVAVLVSLLPNLERLSLSTNWTSETRFLGIMFRSALCDTHRDVSHIDPPRFVSLKHVSLEPVLEAYEHLDPINTHDALALSYLPNVKHLCLSIDNPTHFS